MSERTGNHSGLDSRIVANFPFQHGDGHKIILAAYMGSVSHGTTGPAAPGIDDVDIMGGVIPPFPYLMGWRRFEQWDPVPDPSSALGELDCVFYDLRKLVRLWSKGNPNVLGLLFLQAEHYLVKTPEFESFVSIRDSFASTIAVRALKGYALGQMRDIDKAVYRGYMGAKRKALVDQFGYDTKHAAHTIRILRMGIEYCETGVYNVWRGDRDGGELLSIKRGEWSRERVLSEADRLIAELDEAVSRTSLPEEPDRVTIERVLVEVLGNHLGIAPELTCGSLTKLTEAL